MSEPTNYPLAWPRGYPRNQYPRLAAFRSGSGGSRRLTVAEAMNRLENQVDKFTKPNRTQRVKDLIVSTNIQPTLSGRPRSNQGEPSDAGVAIYFQLDGEPKVFCCDAWTRVADNIAAISSTIEALRGIERWGVAEDSRVFAGFAALPASAESQARSCWDVLDIPPGSNAYQISQAWKAKAGSAHPDRGGSHEAMTALNNAREQAMASLS